MFLCVAFGLAFAPLCWRLLAPFRPAVGGSLGAQDACQQVLLRKNGGSSPSCFVLESSGLQIELEKEARKAEESSLLHDGSATQLTKAKAPVAKDSADEFLHEQLSGHPDHFAQRNWVSWQLLLVAAPSGRQSHAFSCLLRDDEFAVCLPRSPGERKHVVDLFATTA